MTPHRALIPQYLLVGGGLLLGLLVGVVLVDAQPALFGWVFGAGAGLAGGAFVAALATNVSLIGGGRREDVTLEDWDEQPEA